MSGVTQPAHIIVEPFGAAAVDPDYITLPIPVPSQVGVILGAASFEDGFPAATMSDPETEGGVPPFGQDMNGILFMLSQYAALMQAGQRAAYDVDASTAFVGYALGAQLASVSVPGRIWTNNVDGNTNDPDVSDVGWYASDPLYATAAPAAGTQHNYVLPGASDYAIDIDTTAGNLDVTGFVAQRNGQRLYISNTGANLLQFLANNAGSTAANRIRAATDLGVVQNQTFVIQWFGGIAGGGRWLAV